jgi:hypothetical protein
MGGGGGGGGYEAEYRAYVHEPAAYQGQNEINEAARGLIAQGENAIHGRIIPNMNGIDYYREVSRLNMIQTDVVNTQTENYTANYPKFMIDKIIQIEEVYQRVNDYLKFFGTFDKTAFYTSLDNHQVWFDTVKTNICNMRNRADYYKNRSVIQKAIQDAILTQRLNHLKDGLNTATPHPAFELNIPELSRMTREEFVSAFVSQVGNEKRMYLSITAPQTETL